MWIRSQDEEILINLDCITTIRHQRIYEDTGGSGPSHVITANTCGMKENFEIELGRYYSSQRIMEVFEEIEDEITEDESVVYYMPSK